MAGAGSPGDCQVVAVPMMVPGRTGQADDGNGVGLRQRSGDGSSWGRWARIWVTPGVWPPTGVILLIGLSCMLIRLVLDLMFYGWKLLKCRHSRGKYFSVVVQEQVG